MIITGSTLLSLPSTRPPSLRFWVFCALVALPLCFSTVLFHYLLRSLIMLSIGVTIGYVHESSSLLPFVRPTVCVVRFWCLPLLRSVAVLCFYLFISLTIRSKASDVRPLRRTGSYLTLPYHSVACVRFALRSVPVPLRLIFSVVIAAAPFSDSTGYVIPRAIVGCYHSAVGRFVLFLCVCRCDAMRSDALLRAVHIFWCISQCERIRSRIR